jgi:hypothetical protein
MLTLAVPAVLTRYLARVDADPEAGEARRAAVEEPTGWKLAERLAPPAYVALSLWLVAAGIALLV